MWFFKISNNYCIPLDYSFANVCFTKSFVIKFNEYAIYQILRICENCWEIKFRAEWTFDPASVTIPANF